MLRAQGGARATDEARRAGAGARSTASRSRAWSPASTRAASRCRSPACAPSARSRSSTCATSRTPQQLRRPAADLPHHPHRGGPRRGANLVLSRRALLEEEAQTRAAETREQLRPGTVAARQGHLAQPATAPSSTSAASRACSTSASSATRASAHPQEVLSRRPGGRGPGASRSRRGRTEAGQRISLSRRALERDPWQDVADALPRRARASTGKVMRLETFGAFVEIAPGIEGLVHISEMGANRRLNHARDALQVGQEVQVRVLGVDPAKRRISLSMGSGSGGGAGSRADFSRSENRGGGGGGGAGGRASGKSATKRPRSPTAARRVAAATAPGPARASGPWPTSSRTSSRSSPSPPAPLPPPHPNRERGEKPSGFGGLFHSTARGVDCSFTTPATPPSVSRLPRIWTGVRRSPRNTTPRSMREHDRELRDDARLQVRHPAVGPGHEELGHDGAARPRRRAESHSRSVGRRKPGRREGRRGEQAAEGKAAVDRPASPRCGGRRGWR